MAFVVVYDANVLYPSSLRDRDGTSVEDHLVMVDVTAVAALR